MFDRIEVDIIDVALEILVITDSVFPKSPLPQRVFSIPVARDGHTCLRDSRGEPPFDEHPPSREVGISRRQRHDEVQMIRQYHDGINGEWMSLPRPSDGRP